MIVEIDQKSGFCFGVVNAIGKAEQLLTAEGSLYSLGHIVHNELEVERLKNMGLKIIDHNTYFTLKDCKVLIRAHGEPPLIYEYALRNNITLIDGTCPVVLKLQQRVKKAAQLMEQENGQVVIFGHNGHAEVAGLAGQVKNEVMIVDNQDDYQKIDLKRPVVLFSQTTKSIADFRKLIDHVRNNSETNRVETHDTICRQVSNRVPHLEEFAQRFDIVIFAGGLKSSNAQVLFEACKRQNERTYFVSKPEDIQSGWITGVGSVGICGATSTPQWLMEKIAEKIKQL